MFFASPLAFEMFDQDAQSPESGDHTEVISALFAPIPIDVQCGTGGRKHGRESDQYLADVLRPVVFGTGRRATGKESYEVHHVVREYKQKDTEEQERPDQTGFMVGMMVVLNLLLEVLRLGDETTPEIVVADGVVGLGSSGQKDRHLQVEIGVGQLRPQMLGRKGVDLANLPSNPGPGVGGGGAGPYVGIQQGAELERPQPLRARPVG